MNAKSNLLVLLFVLLSISLLLPGVTQPMLTITGTMEKAKLKQTGIDILAESLVSDKQDTKGRERVTQMINGMARMLGISDVSGEIEAYRKTRSIVGTVEDLYHSNNILVAFLVMFFSIVVPTIKLLMTTAMALMREGLTRNKLLSINSFVSKWSMADVFVVALIVTYMAANASNDTGLLAFESNFEVGFYYFAGYCLFSIAASQLLQYQMASVRRQTISNPSEPDNDL